MNVSFKRAYLSVAIAIASLTTQAQAESVNELDEITVVSTATRTEQPIEGVAASVIVIDSEQIKSTGAQTLKDIFNQTPGLTIQYGTFPASSSASKSSVSLRGVGATGSLWLLDGRRLAGEVKNPYDMDRIPASMIERIEVVKGPMSALYGADAVGGVINIITKRPKQGFQGDVSVRYGENTDGDAGQQSINATFRGGKKNIRYSFTASNQTTNPYTETEKTNTKVGSGRHIPSEVPAVPGFLNPNGPTGGNPFYLQANGTVSPMPLSMQNVAGDRATSQNAFSTFRSAVQNNIQDSYNVPVSYREDSDVTTLSGRVEFDFNERLTTGFELNWFEEEREGTYRAAYHPMGYIPPVGHGTNPIVGHNTDGSPISFFEKFGALRGGIPAFDVPVRSKDNNERLDISADVKFEVNDDLTINTRLYRSDYEKRNSTTMLEYQDFGYPSEDKSSSSGMNANVKITSLETNATWAVNDKHLITTGAEIRDENREGTVFSQSNDYGTRSVDYKAIYIQDEWDIKDDLSITLGGRYDDYHQDSYVDGLGNQRDDKTDSKGTYRIGLVKNFNKAFNLRLNAAQGYRVPDIRELFIQKQTPAGIQLGAQTVDASLNKEEYDLKPETVNSFEVGLSGRKGKANYEFVLFHNDIDDRIQQISVDANNDGTDDYFTFENINSATTTGIESRLGFQFNNKLRTDFSWTELDTENKETGKSLEFNPERTIAANINWKASERLNLGTSINYTGKQFYQQAGIDNHTDDYTLVNVNASYAFDSKKKWALFGGVNNVFDEKVDTRLGSNVGTFVFAGVRGSF